MAFKMRGWSAFTKDENLPEEEQSRITAKNKEKLEEVIDTETGEVYPQRRTLTRTVKPLEKALPIRVRAESVKAEPEPKKHSPRFHGLSPERIAEIKAKESKKGVTKNR